jgi:hypothetical protein
MENLSRTHYERVVAFFNKDPSTSLKAAWSIVNAGCPEGDPTYEQFFTAIAPKREISDKEASQIVFQANILFHLYHTQTSGDKLYYITPQLALRLAQTAPSIDAHFLKSPHREFFVMIDPGLFNLRDIDGKLYPCNGFYVYLREVGDAKELRVMAVSVLKPTEQIPFNDTSFFFRVSIGPGKINELISTYVNKTILEKAGEIDIHKGARNMQYLEEFSFFVVNILLYITSQKPDLTVRLPEDFDRKLAGLKNPAKIRKTQQKMERVCSKAITIAGANIVRNERDLQELQAAGSIGAWKLNKRIIVSGHWRVQWYGSSKDNTRHSDPIWIDPYEKGPDMAEVVNKPYIVK